MKLQLKKTIMTLAVFVTFLGIVFWSGRLDLVHAQETDAGGTRAEAMEIELGRTYTETISDIYDKDFFKFTTTVSGYFQIQFAQNRADSSWTKGGWDVSVLDESGEVLTSRSSIEKNWTSIVLPYAKAGKVFYVQVASAYWGDGAVNCLYDLAVTQTAAEDWETELNDTKATATVIQTDRTYHGILVNFDDTDCFQFQTTARGYFQIQFAHNAADPYSVGSGWKISVMDEAGNELGSASDIETNWGSIIFPYAMPGRIFYVQVSNYGISGGAVNCTYDLAVTQKVAPAWELEPNGTAAAATSLALGKTGNGITLSYNDDDYYKVKVSAPGKLNVRLHSSNENQADSVGSGWTLVVYDTKLRELSRMEQVRTADSVSLDVKKGTYYVRVCPYSSWSSPKSCIYEVKATYAKPPAAPKNFSVKAAKKSATLKWKKVSGASGYYVYRSTSKHGKYKKVKTIKKSSSVSWKDKKLKSGRKYYYKIAAYKKVNGMVVMSSYTSIKSVKAK